MPFDAMTVARQLCPQLRPLVAAIALCDGDLARQLRRAATSVPSNIAEGRERAGKDRKHHYRIAFGSVAEAQAQLEIAVAWGYVEESACAEVAVTIDRLRAMLYKLTR